MSLLPLLQSLLGRDGVALTVVNDALHRFEAAATIAKFCSSKLSASTAPTCPSAAACVTGKSLVWHWLFQAFEESSLEARRAAAKILLTQNSSRLMSAIVAYLESHRPSPGDVQLLGILSPLSVSNPEEFVVRDGGLRWIARSIFSLVKDLIPRGTPLLIPSNVSNIQTRILLLVDLYYRLICHDKRFHSHLWETQLPATKNLSPLACFIASYSILTEHPPARINGMEQCAQFLRRLIQPSSMSFERATAKMPDSNSANNPVASLLLNRQSAAAAMARAVASGADLMDGQSDIIMEDVDGDDQTGNDEDEDEEDDEEEGEEEEYDEEEEEEEQNSGNKDEDEEEDEQEEDEDEGDDVHELEEEGNDEGETGQEENDDDIADVVRHFEERLIDINERGNARADGNESRPALLSATCSDSTKKQSFLKAAMQVLAENQNKNATASLTPVSIEALMSSMNKVIKPPKKPFNLKIFMRRAPSQEEFFRGSIGKNPIRLSHLAAAKVASGTSPGEPTIRDLRQYIADQLQMSETAELLELICANKILNLDLKIRVVQQVLWKNHLMENSSSIISSSLLSSSSGASFLSMGSGVSMLISSGIGDRESSGGSNSGRRSSITADTPVSALPPVVITYRLAGVDGEATEDMIEHLDDPEAPKSTVSPDDQEREYGATRVITDGRGINHLLRSIQTNIRDTLRRIRRDDVIFKRNGRGNRVEKNPSLANFQKSQPCSGLTLLLHCTKLPSNRKKLVDARAPTILLRLLLDVLNTIDDSSTIESEADQSANVVSNPTAEVLEHLIETLASDISTEDEEAAEEEMEVDQGPSTLPLLLSSLRTIYLGPPLRKVIAKLLPFLTYGQTALSKELAENFGSFVKLQNLSDCESQESNKTRRFVLMDTFVQAAIHLPANDVCNSLRTELVHCGFVGKLTEFILVGVPEQPPTWTAALWPKKTPISTETAKRHLDKCWQEYFQRTGVRTAFQMLVGLCRAHGPTQEAIAGNRKEERFLKACHWIESTSDNKASRIYLNGIGLVAETLLDELAEGNDDVTKRVSAVRRTTRERKREIAEERRGKALVNIGTFAPLSSSLEQPVPASKKAGAQSILSSALDFFGGSNRYRNEPEGRGTRLQKKKSLAKGETPAKPSWLAELDALEDDEGLTCVVCMEGKTLQPTELIGLYAFVKRVSIPDKKGGSRACVDGTMLLMNLPSSVPTSFVGTDVENYLYKDAKAAGESLRRSTHLPSSSRDNKRSTNFTTTVSAGNAIHCKCHASARSADRNHPKAPKSEWEGATLRNSRVSCNVILPLVTSKSSKVPLVAVDMALSEYQTAVSNLLGARPKSMLWAVLADVRLLVLRMAYGDALNADCGGGSLTSNMNLLFHQFSLAEMFANSAAIDSPEIEKHARTLSGGLVAAMKIICAGDYEGGGRASHGALVGAISDAAPMAALTCILYHNNRDEENIQPEGELKPHLRRRWEVNKRDFLSALVMCAGRRHAQNATDSGCITTRNRGRAFPSRQSPWDGDGVEGDDRSVEMASTRRSKGPTSILGKRGLPKIEDYGKALRPMITLYAIFDALSSVYIPNMTDVSIEENAAFVAKKVEECQKAKSIQDLLRISRISIDHDLIVEDFQRGESAP